jgi:predicted metal-dependent peptidase
MNNAESLSRATKELMLKEPFYGLFLIMLNKVWRTDLDTAGVSKHGINQQLAINPDFWENLSSEYRVGILKHELLHIAFHHLSLRDKYKDHRLFNIAADLEINQYIDRSYLPGGNYADKDAYEAETKIFIDEVKRKLEAKEIDNDEARKELAKVPMRAIFLEDFDELKTIIIIS